MNKKKFPGQELLRKIHIFGNGKKRFNHAQRFICFKSRAPWKPSDIRQTKILYTHVVMWQIELFVICVRVLSYFLVRCWRNCPISCVGIPRRKRRQKMSLSLSRCWGRKCMWIQLLIQYKNEGKKLPILSDKILELSKVGDPWSCFTKYKKSFPQKKKGERSYLHLYKKNIRSTLTTN